MVEGAGRGEGKLLDFEHWVTAYPALSSGDQVGQTPIPSQCSLSVALMPSPLYPCISFMGILEHKRNKTDRTERALALWGSNIRCDPICADIQMASVTGSFLYLWLAEMGEKRETVWLDRIASLAALLLKQNHLTETIQRCCWSHLISVNVWVWVVGAFRLSSGSCYSILH